MHQGTFLFSIGHDAGNVFRALSKLDEGYHCLFSPMGYLVLHNGTTGALKSQGQMSKLMH